MTTRKARFDIQINPHTDTMRGEALQCRGFGHLWRVYDPPTSVRAKQLAQGYIEYERRCENQCGCEWTTRYSVPGFKLLSSKRTFPRDGYLMPSGHGRLNRTEALSARFARQFPALIK